MSKPAGGAVKAVSGVLEKAIEWLVAVMFTVLIVSCVTQIFMRTFVNLSPPWTEELARYAFMYVNIIGAAICVRKKSHARVTVILDALGPVPRAVLETFADLAVLFVSVIMMVWGMQCVLQVSGQLSPAMRLSMSFVYFCIPLSGACIAFETVLNLARDLAAFAGKGGTRDE